MAPSIKGYFGKNALLHNRSTGEYIPLYPLHNDQISKCSIATANGQGSEGEGTRLGAPAPVAIGEIEVDGLETTCFGSPRATGTDTNKPSYMITMLGFFVRIIK